MSTKTSADLADSAGDGYLGDEVEGRRIVSEDAAHYVLIKGCVLLVFRVIKFIALISLALRFISLVYS